MHEMTSDFYERDEASCTKSKRNRECGVHEFVSESLRETRGAFSPSAWRQGEGLICFARICVGIGDLAGEARTDEGRVFSIGEKYCKG